MEKKIFLDIACFFKGKSYDYVTKILECCGFHPEIGMTVLLDRSLITISENRLWMHDLLQQMGQEIVRRSSFELEPGKVSRLWLYKDVYHVFMQNTGTEEVEGIVLDSVKREGEHLNPKAFVKMKRLRLLKLQNLQFHLASGLEYLSNELQYLEWLGYPFKSLPSSFRANKLVELNLRCSQIEQLWKGKRIKLLENLRFISLSHSQNLVKTPDFEGLPNVEVLNLEGCTRLFAVHQSIGVLKRLVLLNLKDCKNLESLPSSICNLMSLKILILSGCSKLEKLPEKLGYITCLEELHLGRTAIRQLPPSVIVSKSLQVLSFQGHRGVKRKSRVLHFPFRLLPRRNTSAMALMFPSLLAVCHLKNLDLSDCELKEGMIPDALSCFVALETLILTGNDFVSIPVSIRTLSKLEVLYVDNCKRLELLPELPQGIKYVNMNDCTSLVSLPNPLEVNHSSDGFEYTFTNCTKLIELQGNYSGMGFSWLRRCLHLLLKKLPQGFFDFDMCLPASESPAWFNYQAVGSSASIPLHPHWCNANWKGFAVSALFAVDENAIDNESKEDDHDSEILKLQCFLLPNIEKFPRLLPSTLTLPRDKRPDLDRHWLIHVPGCLYLGGVDWWNKCSQIEVTFASKGLEVKRCGIRLVYEEDVEALDPNKNSGDRGLENLGVKSCENYNIGDAVKGNKSGSPYGEVLHSKRLRVLAS